MLQETPRYITLLGATGQIRVAKYKERNHLVVPVVALVEGVLHSGNRKHPEFVSADVIAATSKGWNGRPVVVGHPQEGTEFVSANSPQFLENALGLIFNSEFKDGKLVFEAWIDKEKIPQPDSEEAKLLAKIEANKMIEVSIGAFVAADEKPGVFKGKQFSQSWKTVVPDHIAFLREGEIGACSNEAGCGAPRVATVHLVSATGFTPLTEVSMTPEIPPVVVGETPKKSLREKILELMLGDTSEIKPVISPEPVVNAQSSTCGCATRGGTMDKAQRVKTLIESGRFVEADRKWLDTVPEDRLSALEAQPAVVPQVVPPVVQASTQATVPQVVPQVETVTTNSANTMGEKGVTAEQYIALAPKEIQESLREGLRVQQARRTEILTALKATNRCDYNDEQLAAFGTADLERMLKLADIPQPNFIGRVNVNRTEENKGVPPAPSLQAAIRASRSVTK